jgi:hypothetical protein
MHGLVAEDISPDALLSVLESFEEYFVAAQASHPHLDSRYRSLVSKVVALSSKYSHYASYLKTAITAHLIPRCWSVIRCFTTGHDKMDRTPQLRSLGRSMWRMLHATPPFSARCLRTKTDMLTVQLGELLHRSTTPITVWNLQVVVAILAPVCLSMRLKAIVMDDERVFKAMLDYNEHMKLVYMSVKRRYEQQEWKDKFEAAKVVEIAEVKKKTRSLTDEEAPAGPSNTPEETSNQSHQPLSKATSPEAVVPNKSSKKRKNKKKSSTKKNSTLVPNNTEQHDDEKSPTIPVEKKDDVEQNGVQKSSPSLPVEEHDQKSSYTFPVEKNDDQEPSSILLVERKDDQETSRLPVENNDDEESSSALPAEKKDDQETSRLPVENNDDQEPSSILLVEKKDDQETSRLPVENNDDQEPSSILLVEKKDDQETSRLPVENNDDQEPSSILLVEKKDDQETSTLPVAKDDDRKSSILSIAIFPIELNDEKCSSTLHVEQSDAQKFFTGLVEHIEKPQAESIEPIPDTQDAGKTSNAEESTKKEPASKKKNKKNKKKRR